MDRQDAKAKRRKEREKKKDKDKDKSKDDKKADEEEDKNDEKERDDKVRASTRTPALEVLANLRLFCRSRSLRTKHPQSLRMDRASSISTSEFACCSFREVCGSFARPRNFFQMRLDRLRNMEQAKRNRERLKDPSTFPSVPKSDF
jgi:hypothetical protein